MGDDRRKSIRSNRCGNCHELRDDHANNKCPFAASNFRQMTDEEAYQYYLNRSVFGFSPYSFAKAVLPPKPIK